MCIRDSPTIACSSCSYPPTTTTEIQFITALATLALVGIGEQHLYIQSAYSCVQNLHWLTT
eukprot:4960554-Karenia_brevis.AAC.1